MTVLVTGATGFVGLNLLHAFEDPSAVRAMVRPSSTTSRLPDVETVEADLTEPETLTTAMAGVDAVVHLGAAVYAESAMAETNVRGTENLVDAATEAGVESFVFLSTIGAHPDVAIDEGSTYQRSKGAVEELLFEGGHPFDVTALYPTYILGQRDYRLTRFEHVWPIAANRVLVPPLYTYDEYNIVHVDDVVASIDRALDGAIAGRHLVTGPNVSNGRFLRTVARHAPGNCRVIGVPYPVMRWGIKPAMDLLHRIGVSPVPGAGFLERGDYGTVGEGLTERAPVEQRSWQRAVRDTVEWYEAVGIL